jgi:hypothetical protein
MAEFPTLLEKLGRDGLDELRRLIADEIARRPTHQPPPNRTNSPGPDEDLRPRS